MSEEQLKAFLEKVKADTSLQEKLKAAADANAVVEIAKEAGFTISADDLTKAVSEISDEELEGVAGGNAVGRYFELLGQGLLSPIRWPSILSKLFLKCGLLLTSNSWTRGLMPTHRLTHSQPLH